MSESKTSSLVMDALTSEEESAFSPSRLSYLVEVMGGSTQGTTMPLKGRLVVGSTPEADLVLTDPTVSRRHAMFELTP